MQQQAREEEVGEESFYRLHERYGEQSKEKKIELRQKYLQLIADMDSSRDDLVKSDSKALLERIDETNDLFADVCAADDAILDSKVLLMATDIGLKKTREMKFDSSVFSIDEYMTKLARSLGISEDFEISNWFALENLIGKASLRAPPVDFMLGPLQMEPKVRERRKAVRHEKDKNELVVAAQLEKDQIKDKNATTSNVIRVWRVLNDVGPVHFFNFIINPVSFSQSVENLFYLSFLIRDGKAKLDHDDDGLPYVEALHDTQSDRDKDDIVNRQLIIDLDMKTWRDAIELFEITESTIPSREPCADATHNGKWIG